MKKLPLKSIALVEQLSEIFPLAPTTPQMLPAEIYYQAGIRFVVDTLQRRYKEQFEEDIQEE